MTIMKASEQIFHKEPLVKAISNPKAKVVKAVKTN